MQSSMNACLMEASRLVASKLAPSADEGSWAESSMALSCEPATPSESSGCQESSICSDAKRRAMGSPVATGREMCRHWMRGYCAMGESCAFSHGGGGTVLMHGMSVEGIPSQEELREKDLFIVVKSSVPCKDYQAGKCHRGDKCKFAHIGTVRRTDVLCRDWQSGVCSRGGACRYRHSFSQVEGMEFDELAERAQEYLPRVNYVHAPAPQNTVYPTSHGTNTVVLRAQPTVQRIIRYVTAGSAPQTHQPVVYVQQTPGVESAPQPNPTTVYVQHQPQQQHVVPMALQHSHHQCEHVVEDPRHFMDEEAQWPVEQQHQHQHQHQVHPQHQQHPDHQVQQHWEQPQQHWEPQSGGMPPSPPASYPHPHDAAQPQHGNPEEEVNELMYRLQEAEAQAAELRQRAMQAESEAAMLRQPPQYCYDNALAPPPNTPCTTPGACCNP